MRCGKSPGNGFQPEDNTYDSVIPRIEDNNFVWFWLAVGRELPGVEEVEREHGRVIDDGVVRLFLDSLIFRSEKCNINLHQSISYSKTTTLEQELWKAARITEPYPKLSSSMRATAIVGLGLLRSHLERSLLMVSCIRMSWRFRALTARRGPDLDASNNNNNKFY